MIGRVTRDARRRRGRGRDEKTSRRRGGGVPRRRTEGKGRRRAPGGCGNAGRGFGREGKGSNLRDARFAEGFRTKDASREMRDGGCAVFHHEGGMLYHAKTLANEPRRRRATRRSSRLPFRDCPFETALSRLSRVSSAQFRCGVVTYFHTKVLSKVSYFTSPERGASFIRRERPILRPPLPPRRRRRRGGSR